MQDLLSLAPATPHPHMACRRAVWVRLLVRASATGFRVKQYFSEMAEKVDILV